MALNVLVGMWDDYWFNQNNFYLYNDPATGRFTFIPFDYDNTFGIDWFDIDWAERDVFTFGYPPLTGGGRPLVDRILAVPAYRVRYQQYIERLLRGPFKAEVLTPRVEALRTFITPAAEADSFRTLDYGWDIDAFQRSFTEALGAHVKHGITGYISAREASAWSQAGGGDAPPVLSYLRHTFDAETTVFTVLVEDEQEIDAVQLQLGSLGGPDQQHMMLDDGQSGDREAGDGIYGYQLASRPTAFSYAVIATDLGGQETTSGTVEVNASIAEGPLYINEIMASNDSTLADEAGEFDDWIEIYNNSDAAQSLNGLFLSDDPNRPNRWAFPDVSVPANGFLLVWLDDDTEQGELHASFKLERNGEEIGLYEPAEGGFSALDLIVFEAQRPDTSYGRSPDGGTALEFFATPTPGASNAMTTQVAPPEQEMPLTLNAYPNPFAGHVRVEVHVATSTPLQVTVYDALGRRVARLADRVFAGGTHQLVWRGAGAAGLYMVRVEDLRTGTSTMQTLIRVSD